MRLAQRYWKILSSFFEIGVQYGPRACGPRSILKPQFLRIQIVFSNTSSPDAQYSSNTDTLCSILALYVLLNLLMPILNLLMPLFQPPNATFSIFQECQSCESEVLVWVCPNHSSSTRDLEKPILALPLHWIGPLYIMC